MSPLISRREVLKHGTTGVLATALLGLVRDDVEAGRELLPTVGNNAADGSRPTVGQVSSEPARRADTSHLVTGYLYGELRRSGEVYGAHSARKLEVRRRVDGSATVRVYAIGGDGTALVTVDIPAPAGDELLAAFS